MAITSDQINKANAVYATLVALENVHQSRQMIAHHHALAALLGTFQADLMPADYQAMGGGTNKDGQ